MTDVAAANPPRRGEGLPSPIAAATAAPGECAGERAAIDAVGGERTAGDREGDRVAVVEGACLDHSGLGAASAPVVVGNAPPKTPNEVGGGEEGAGSGSGSIASAAVASAEEGRDRAVAGSSGSSSSSSSPREYASTSANVTRRRLDGVAPNGSGVVSPGAGTNARAAPNAPSPGDVVDRDAPAWREGRARRAGGWARRRSRGRARGLVLFGPDGGVERGVEVEGVGLLRNVVRKAGGARGDVRGVGGGDVGVRGARRGAGGEVRSGTRRGA